MLCTGDIAIHLYLRELDHGQADRQRGRYRQRDRQTRIIITFHLFWKALKGKERYKIGLSADQNTEQIALFLFYFE